MHRSDKPSCANCGMRLAGEWCHECGQRRFRPEHRSLRHIATEAFQALTDLDGRFPRTLKDLCLHPGRMAQAYLAGARRRYLSPVTLFLLANLLYFVAPPLSDLDPSLYEHMNFQPYSGAAVSLVEARIEQRNTTLAAYSTAFETRQDSLARSLVVLHTPFLALGLALLHVGRQRPFADHVLVALYLLTVCLVAVLTVPWLLAFLGRALQLDAATGAIMLRAGLVGALFAWFYALLRGAYEQPRWLAAVKTPAVIVALFLSSVVYRGLLFLLVFAST